MASQAPQNALPLLYKDLVPISSQEHGSWRIRVLENAPWAAKEHAIPLTIEEFAVAQRFYPIIFSSGDNPVPLALMGLNEGVNTYLDDSGKMIQEGYVPAYLRRYPYLLARLRSEGDELSLCVDPTAAVIGPFDEGEPLFVDNEPSDAVKAILQFCEQFEQAGLKTGQFMAEIKEHDLLMEGEVSIQTDPDSPPFIYRGFQMVNEEKLREMRGDQLRKMNQSGLLALVHAHLFSLQLMREIFARQIGQGKMPEQVPA